MTPAATRRKPAANSAGEIEIAPATIDAGVTRPAFAVPF